MILYLMGRKPRKSDMVLSRMTDNETWNDCPECNNFWKDKFPTPGLLHRTRVCSKCRKLRRRNDTQRTNQVQ